MELSDNRANTLADFAYVLSRFKMPGDGLIPDYKERLRSSGAGISSRAFLERAVMPLFKMLGTSRNELKFLQCKHVAPARRRARAGTLNPPRIKRQYVWAKTGGLCWYCGAQLYRREEADTEVQKRLVFTADHLHPRAHGGRGRANKVPACRYCNSHKRSRSVEQFRQWVQKLLFDKTKHAGRPVGEPARRRWKTNAEAVVFYFELARVPNSDLRDPS